MTVRPDRKYAKTHEWAQLLPDGSVLVGITDYAQSSLGDITYVGLPKPGTQYNAGETFGVVESVKAASDLYLPVAGTVAAVNEALTNGPEAVNHAPYDAGWMLKLQPVDTNGLAVLLTPADYETQTA